MVTIEEIYKQVDEALKAPKRKCLVLTLKDYTALKKHLQEHMELPEDKQIGTLKSFNDINVYMDDSCAFSFTMNEELYLEAKKIPQQQEYFIPLSQTKKYRP